MTKKTFWLLIAVILFLIFGLYIGIDVHRRCRGPLKQRTIRISITKPFVIGYWSSNWQIGIGPAWEDLNCQWYYEQFERYGNPYD